MRYPIFDCHTHIYPAKIAAASVCAFAILFNLYGAWYFHVLIGG